VVFPQHSLSLGTQKVSLYVLFITKEQHCTLGDLQAGSQPDGYSIAFIVSADVPAKSWLAWFAPSFTASPSITVLEWSLPVAMAELVSSITAPPTRRWLACIMKATIHATAIFMFPKEW